MKVFVILLSVFALTLGYVINDRIYGGHPTIIEKHPYQVSLQYNQQIHNCGGSIVNDYTIVTAAHCVHGLTQDNITVVVGSTYLHSGEKYEVAKIIEHPMFFVGTQFNNDIAVLKLAKPLAFSDKVKSIDLQPAGSPVPEGTTAQATGWGGNMPGFPSLMFQLQEVDLDVISNEKCQSFFDKKEIVITSSMLCVLSPDKGTYIGDSGGPLVVNNTLIGVTSLGSKYGFPDVFANVAVLNEFVTKC